MSTKILNPEIISLHTELKKTVANKLLNKLDKTILQECLDTRTVLDGKQYKYIDNNPCEVFCGKDYFCYHVIPRDSNNKLFLDRDLLKQYLVKSRV